MKRKDRECWNLPVSTHPTKRKRNPKMGSTIWQLAATTTPATIRPPSIFSTRSREIGAGHWSLFTAPTPMVAPHPWAAVGAAASTGTSLGLKQTKSTHSTVHTNNVYIFIVKVICPFNSLQTKICVNCLQKNISSCYTRILQNIYINV